MHFCCDISPERTSRPRDAAAQLREAIRLEPHFATSYLSLGAALEVAGEPEAADAAYSEFVARAPRGAAARVALVRQRIEVLGGTAASAVRTP